MKCNNKPESWLWSLWQLNKEKGIFLRHWWTSNKKAGPCYETFGSPAKTWDHVTKPLNIKRKPGPWHEPNRESTFNKKQGSCCETNGSPTKGMGLVTKLMENHTKINTLARNDSKCNKRTLVTKPKEVKRKTWPVLWNWWKSIEKPGPCYETEGNLTKNWALVTKLMEIKRKPYPLLRNRRKSFEEKTRALVTKLLEITLKTRSLLRNWMKSNEKPGPC